MNIPIIVLMVALSLRLSAQTGAIPARQKTSGQIKPSTSGDQTKVHGKTKAGEEGSITTKAGTGGAPTGSASNMSRRTTNTRSSQKGKPVYTTKSTSDIIKQTVPSKNANNKNGSKTNSSTTTSGSGKKDM